MDRVSSARIQSFPPTSNRPLAPRCLPSVTLFWIGLVFWSIPLSLSADPITITSGMLTGEDVAFYGPGLVVQGELHSDITQGLEIKHVSPFASSYPLSARLVGVAGDELLYTLDLSVFAGSAAPAFFEALRDGPFVLMRSEATGRFTLSGRVTTILRETGQQVFESDVIGTGTVRSGFYYWVSDPSPPRPWVSYTFEKPAAPVPEPTTLALLGGGLIGLLCRRCKGGRS